MNSPDSQDPFQHLQQTYFDECAELLDVLVEQSATLVPDDPDREKLNTIFRAVHSIKAGAGAFRFTRLVAFSHSFEAVLERVRSAELRLTPDLIDVLIRSADILLDLVAAAQTGTENVSEAEESLRQRLDEFVGIRSCGQDTGEGTGAGAAGSCTIRFTPRDGFLASGNDPLLIIAELATLGDLKLEVLVGDLPALADFDGSACAFSWTIDLTTDAPLDDVRAVFEFVTDVCDLEIDVASESAGASANDGADAGMDGAGLFEASSAPPAMEGAAPGAGMRPATTDDAAPARPRTSSIRVDLQRVDRLVNMVGELVIAQSMVLQNIRDKTASHELSQLRGLEDLTLRTRELQESVMAIRMQPVKSVFSRMPRVVRDLADQLGKKVRLVTSGEETEVDKTVIEELSDPLTHMIRNALDHGLESPEDRQAKGKDETGTIELTAAHRGGRILICISDDGRGINRERVRAKAVERRIISEDVAQSLSAPEVDQLIFSPGFSTAQSVSEISGRGVGMDVVRRNIQSLGGRITTESAPGKGTKFILTLPLTLAVLDGMVISLAGERFILPLTGILECVRPQKQDLRMLTGGSEVLSIRGAFIPLVNLADRLGIATCRASAADALVVLVEMDSGRKVGLVVDDLIGQQQVVIKSLEENYHSIPGISGATILGDGRVALIIDVDSVSTATTLQGNLGLPPVEDDPLGPGAGLFCDPTTEHREVAA